VRTAPVTTAKEALPLALFATFAFFAPRVRLLQASPGPAGEADRGQPEPSASRPAAAMAYAEVFRHTDAIIDKFHQWIDRDPAITLGGDSSRWRFSCARSIRPLDREPAS
jgi:hypothetical protein